jgi:sugar/nucleoside kinase (ribokinase family)
MATNTNSNDNIQQVRQDCAQKLTSISGQVPQLSAFVGLDGFVDEILHVVDKRENVDSFQRIPSITKFAERIAAAAGRSTNFELVRKLTKLGGNGPIMANALAAFGIKVTYLGALGWPNMDPVFNEFTKRAEVHTMADPGHTDALEFDDGKLLCGKLTPLNEVNWANIQERFGKEKFAQNFNSANLVGFVNWTMLPYMSEIWEHMQAELCPHLQGPRRFLFVDLCDPEKRSRNDITKALDLILSFNRYFDVILGLNEKEAFEVAAVLNLAPQPHTKEGVTLLAGEIQKCLPVQTVVVHPVAYAVACSAGVTDLVDGPFCEKPFITTGAGDHFNAGFCLGKLLGLSNAMSLVTGVSTSGFYVRSAKSPTVQDLAGLMTNWPSK